MQPEQCRSADEPHEGENRRIQLPATEQPEQDVACADPQTADHAADQERGTQPLHSIETLRAGGVAYAPAAPGLPGHGQAWPVPDPYRLGALVQKKTSPAGL